MNIEHLREFVELSRQLNFTSTARTLHMTQPALSNHVRSMEQEAGVTLIERSAREGARLTPAGQLFLNTAKQILALYDGMLPQLRDVQREVQGKIVVRSPRNEYSSPLLDYIYEFRTQHPQVDVVILPWTDVDGFEDVASGAVDCAYIGYVDECSSGDPAGELTGNGGEGAAGIACPGDGAGVGLVAYAQVEVLLWVDRGHPLAGSERLDVSALDGETLLIPANKKHDSWLAVIGYIIRNHGLSCHIDEKYCDSLEDLMLSKVQPRDLMLCDANLLNSSVFRLRPDRTTLHFSPALTAPVSLAYRTGGLAPGRDANDRLALAAFVDFLRGKA